MEWYLILSYHLLGFNDFHSDLISTELISFLLVFERQDFHHNLWCHYHLGIVLSPFQSWCSSMWLFDLFDEFLSRLLCFNWISRRVVQWCVADQSCGSPLCSCHNLEQQPKSWMTESRKVSYRPWFQCRGKAEDDACVWFFR